MLYHVEVGIVGIDRYVAVNLSLEEALARYVCPLITGEITYFDGGLARLQSFASLRVSKSTRAVDDGWPVDRAAVETTLRKDAITWEKDYEYQKALLSALRTVSDDATMEAFREASDLLKSGRYREILAAAHEGLTPGKAFFVCVTDDPEVREAFNTVVRPTVRAAGFEIERADDISTTREITAVIVAAIRDARFVIADLTGERPNCYYEVGYAHALGKPVLITAKRGTPRHFDIAAYRWNYWDQLSDLQPLIEKGVAAVTREVALSGKQGGTRS